MSFQSLNPELTAKVIFLANLQRSLMQNQNNEKIIEGNIPTNTIGQQQQQQLVHPLLMPSLNVSSQKISAMLAALTPSSPTANTAQSAVLSNVNNHSVIPPMANAAVNIRPNGSSFGWGNRERKMEENWRLQNRHI